MKKIDPAVEKHNMNILFAVWAAVCGISMWGMIWYGCRKTIVIADMSKEQPAISTEAGNTEAQTEYALLFKAAQTDEETFRIPLPKDLKPENIVMENRYMSGELWIYLEGAQEDFYRQNSVYGDISLIGSGYVREWEQGIILRLTMKELREYRSTMEGSELTIVCSRPRELYDFLVVLDPAYGGSETGASGYGLTEKELTLEVARQVQKNFDVQNVRLYITRTEDSFVSGEKRLELAKELGADLYIRIVASSDKEHSEKYGITGFYDEDYFIPVFGNAELADIVTREVTAASSNRAVGLFALDDGSMIKGLDIPAMELSVGYLSNETEETLLTQDVYREKLAAGIINGIREACGKLEQIEEP